MLDLLIYIAWMAFCRHLASKAIFTLNDAVAIFVATGKIMRQFAGFTIRLKKETLNISTN
jgi:hypothetical protein